MLESTIGLIFAGGATLGYIIGNDNAKRNATIPTPQINEVSQIQISKEFQKVIKDKADPSLKDNADKKNCEEYLNALHKCLNDIEKINNYKRYNATRSDPFDVIHPDNGEKYIFNPENCKGFAPTKKHLEDNNIFPNAQLYQPEWNRATLKIVKNSETKKIDVIVDGYRV